MNTLRLPFPTDRGRHGGLPLLGEAQFGTPAFQTQCKRIPNIVTLNYLCLHTRAHRTRGVQDNNLNKHTQHAQKQFEHSGEPVPETQMGGGTNACERTARLMPTAAPRCPFTPSEFLIQSSFGQTVRAEPDGFLFSFLFTSLLSASSKNPRQCGHHNVVMTRLKCDY